MSSKSYDKASINSSNLNLLQVGGPLQQVASAYRKGKSCTQNNIYIEKQFNTFPGNCPEKASLHPKTAYIVIIITIN